MMSEMEAAYGKFKKSDVLLMEGENAYDAGDRLALNLVEVDGQVYEFETISSPDAHGFSMYIKPSDEGQFMCLWYNGGAGIHEVVEDAIRKASKEAGQ